MKVMLVQFGITLQSLWSHSVYTKVRFLKTLISPRDSNGFIKCRRLPCRIEKQTSLMNMSIRMRFGSILDPFWLRFGLVLRLSGRIECKFASDRPQVAPKSAHKQIKYILPKDVRVAAIRKPSEIIGDHRNSASGNSKSYQFANPFD